MHARQLSSTTKPEEKLRVINELIQKLRDKKPSYQEFEANFLEKFYSRRFPKDKRLIQYILAKLYRYNNKSGIPIDYLRMTIEHLAPENPTSASSNHIPDETVAQIGNLILVDDELNKKLANKQFVEKKTLLLGSSVWLDPIVKKASIWGKYEIEERSRNLAKLAFEKVWAF